ncbi:MAG: glycosyltransferase [Planctomycetota bacterium]|nr:glycosyltransferase [Planctomycetota bacterium]
MDLSVLIPTFGRPDKVAACAQRLADQTLDIGRYEVLIGIDGGSDDPTAARKVEKTVRARWPAAHATNLTIVPCPKVGQAAVRNVLLDRAGGSTLVFLNDDMLPTPALLEHHLQHQQDAAAQGAPALIVGASPWVVPEHDTLFDRLVRETSMVFFYDQMDEALGESRVDRDHDWGFRHAWLLNLSAPAALVRDVGAFSVFPSTYGYEDDEFAFRCRERFGTRVLYRADTVAHHDHRLTPRGYLDRERRLGFAAWGFAGMAPACAREMFGRDIRRDDEITYSGEFVERERHNAERLRVTFEDFANLPGDGVPSRDHPAGLPVARALAQQHLLLKRWEWRRGLLEAARAEALHPAEA